VTQTFVIGDIVSRAAVTDKNILLNAEGKTPTEYTQLLLGITKVSTWSDSFLSAASFQNTTHVLINAATQGKVDELYGLKENVIIGRKIPVGTGARGRLLAPSDHQSLDEQTEI
jgi:DNA-directed RNA polymerase subunit beta'